MVRVLAVGVSLPAQNDRDQLAQRASAAEAAAQAEAQRAAAEAQEKARLAVRDMIRASVWRVMIDVG